AAQAGAQRATGPPLATPLLKVLAYLLQLAQALADSATGDGQLACLGQQHIQLAHGHADAVRRGRLRRGAGPARPPAPRHRAVPAARGGAPARRGGARPPAAGRLPPAAARAPRARLPYAAAQERGAATSPACRWAARAASPPPAPGYRSRRAWRDRPA